ncbi:MAG: 2OG-Fe(II) oxygenase [Ilumatobacteraceae bacterium]
MVDGLEWSAIGADLEALGVALTGPVLDAGTCADLAATYDDDARFRSTVDMGRHRFGEGEYRYFARPLPELVTVLRAAFWSHLLPVARAWAKRRGQPSPWTESLDDWLAACHAAGQTRPTPLLLRYGPGDWNALHRDLYGDLVFPLQVVIGLDEPGADYTGGEFVVVEQRPRAQSRATTITIPQGHAVVVTTRDRPVRSARGWAAAPMRHGVSVVRSGRRRTLGLVFHDAI